MIDRSTLETAAQAIASGLHHPAIDAGLILGSGWNDVVEAFDIHATLPYADIPGLGRTGVQGHAGQVSHGTLAGLSTLIFQGRRHLYEGTGPTPVAIPVHTLRHLGARRVLLTNAAGGIREDLHPGSLMILEDHINFTGTNPLTGPHDDIWGPRFPDQSTLYTPALREGLHQAARAEGVPVTSGVYLASSGPTYETPAEVRAYRTLGADAVGMSTVPEATLASAAGLEVAGLSCITNYAAGIATAPLSHDEVTEATAEAMPRMTRLLRGFWTQMGSIS